MCKVSIITPIYNGSDFILEHYASVLDCLKYEFEIIYVDNNSADHTVQIVESLIANDSRVKLYHCYKQGPSAARNVGLSVSKGDVWVFLDIDDILVGNVVNEQIAMSMKLIPTQCQVRFSGTEAILPIWNSNTDYNFYLNFGNQCPFSTLVCPRSTLLFNEDFKTSEDWIFILENRKVFRKMKIINSVGRVYRENTGFSHKILEQDILSTHVQAFKSYYQIPEEVAVEILNRFYYKKKVINIPSRILFAWFTEIYGLKSAKSLLRLVGLFYV